MINYSTKEILTQESVIDFKTGAIQKTVEVDGVINVTFSEEHEGIIHRWIMSLSREQFTHIAREVNIKPLSTEQLQAIHAKKAEEEVKEAVAVNEPLVQITIPAKITNTNTSVTRLPTEKAEPLNWKNTEPEREARRIRSRIDDDKVVQMLNYVFSWHKKNKYANSHKDKNRNLAHFLKTIVPNAFSLPFESCQRIYCGRSYQDIGARYREQWVQLVADLVGKGYDNQVPGYLKKHYG